MDIYESSVIRYNNKIKIITQLSQRIISVSIVRLGIKRKPLIVFI